MQPAWTTLVVILPFMLTVLGNDIMGPTPVSEKLPSSIINATKLVSALGCQNLLSPKGECSFHGNVNITISATYPCVYSCSYYPKNGPLRMEVHLAYKHPASNPTFVSIEQSSFLNSWSLPVIFPVHGENQKFTSIEEILCPPAEQEKLNVRITTRSAHNISLLFGLKNQTYSLKKGDNVSVTVTPVSPWYKLYEWTEKENSVLITADSEHNSDTVCATLALQNAECPVDTGEARLWGGHGRYQTFNARAGMVARRSEFPDGVHMIVSALPDDEPCSLSSAQTANHTRRQKTVVLAVYDHATIWSTWYIYLLTAAVLAGVTVALTKLALALIMRSLGTSINGDQRQLLEESMESFERGCRVVESGGAIFTGMNNSNASGCRSMDTRGENSSSGVGASGRNESEELGETEGIEREELPATISLSVTDDNSNRQDNAMILSANEHPAIASPAIFPPNSSVMNFSPTFNPQFVWWWKRVAVLESERADAQIAEVGFKHGVLIMAVFAALPTAELIRSYLGMLMHYGQEDQCFFNSRCLTAFGTLPDFTRVFTNIGYVFTGIALCFIVKKHKELSQTILSNFAAYNSVGVSRHYGLFVTLGNGLIIQGIMSSLYHTCPNSVTIRLDMLFMYVVLVVTVIITWGLRHGDVTDHIYPTLAFISMLLIIAEVREWINKMVFWAVFSTIYSLILLANTVLLANYGQWSFSPYKMWCVRKAWKPVLAKLDGVVRQEDQTSQPIKVLRIVLGLALNLGLIVYGFVVDPNVYRYILIIFLSNMGLYFGNYILTKRLCYGEKGTPLAWVSLVVSLLLWILALIAFSFHSTDSEASPSSSRAMNSPCDFLLVYDTHDLWHVLSAFALFTFFLGILTMDDDLCHTSSKYIHVF